MSLPRNGHYELFIYLNTVNCFDDPDFVPIKVSSEMHEWIQKQPKNLWRALDPPYNVYYLQPKLYNWFKMRWM